MHTHTCACTLNLHLLFLRYTLWFYFYIKTTQFISLIVPPYSFKNPLMFGITIFGEMYLCTALKRNYFRVITIGIVFIRFYQYYYYFFLYGTSTCMCIFIVYKIDWYGLGALVDGIHVFSLQSAYHNYVIGGNNYS